MLTEDFIVYKKLFLERYLCGDTKMNHNLSMLRYFLLMFLCGKHVSSDQPCEKAAESQSHLDVATDMILKAKSHMPTCSDVCNIRSASYKSIDCAEVYNMGYRKSGKYMIWPINRVSDGDHLDVFCDMDTDGGGWTVIQRRGNFGRPEDYFYKDWKSYKEGFGDIEQDFWLGNDNIFALTNQKPYSVRFDLQDVELNKRYAKYDSFWIDDEFYNYTLHIFNYSGNAGDSMAYHNYKKFSTKDRRNDNWVHKGFGCAVYMKGAWWYDACYFSNLNGLYHRGKYSGAKNGVTWETWKGRLESLESTEIKIRPKIFPEK